jgi:phosphonate transport system substrate-binding protein
MTSRTPRKTLQNALLRKLPRDLPGLLAVVLLALLLSVPLMSCGDNEPVRHVDLTKREPITFHQRQEEITYAYAPQYSHATSYQRHHLLVEYLAEVTGLRMRQVFPDTFGEHMNMVEQGLIDISFSNPFIYIKMAERQGAWAFARAVEPEGRNFRGQIITRADNPRIKSLQDVRGERWLAVDPSSAGGYLYPLGHFIENGIHKEDFAEIAFAPGPGGKQEKVVLGVYSGKYGVGSIREGTLDIVANTIDVSQIRVLDVSRWYPGWVYAARKGLDPEIVRKIRDAMIALDITLPTHRPILENAGLTAIIPSQDTDFNPVRRLAEMVGEELVR